MNDKIGEMGCIEETETCDRYNICKGYGMNDSQ